MAESSGLIYQGSVPCDLTTLMPNLANVRKLCEKLEKPNQTIFLLTHIGGWINPQIGEIVACCKEYGVEVVEDCAHSLGATLNGKHSGIFGIAGVYSLYATKAIPVGEGGIMITNNEELYDSAQRYIKYDRFDQKMRIGVNFRTSEINALLAFSVLINTDNIIHNKHKIAERYNEICDNKNIQYMKPHGENYKSNLYKYIIIDPARSKCNRYKKIKNRTSCVYDYALGEDPENICENHICLPIWYNLDNKKIIETVKQIEQI